MIPEKFSRKYGEELQRHVQLKAPDGAAWRVDVQRKGGKVWLRNGWPEFATYYSLCFGHCILFEYQGNCNLKVVKFDKSATEIEYPLEPEKRRRESEMEELKACKRKRSVHSGNCVMQNWKREKFPKASSYMEITSINEEESADIEIPNHANGNGDSTSRIKKPIKLEVDLNKPMQHHDNIRGKLVPLFILFLKLFSDKFFIYLICNLHAAKGVGRSASKKECSRALASANAFKSSYPFFIKVMQPSFVGKTYGWVRK